MLAFGGIEKDWATKESKISSSSTKASVLADSTVLELDVNDTIISKACSTKSTTTGPNVLGWFAIQLIWARTSKAFLLFSDD